MIDGLLAAVPPAVRICEVGPRDGLQNEAVALPVETRLALVRELAAAGLRRIEVGAFVSPRRVPQMAGTAELVAQLGRLDGVVRSVLVPNAQGLQAALAAGVEEIAVFTAASEVFCRRNINCGIADSLARFGPLVALAREHNVAVRGYVSCIAVCPYAGPVEAARVVEVAAALHAMGCGEIALGDTVGRASPRAIDTLLRQLRGAVPLDRLALHAHDTCGLALANVLVALEHGVTALDSAVAGLGGCPFAPGAGGNLATEDLVFMLDGLGVATGVDLDAVCRAGERVNAHLDRQPRSRLSQATATRHP